MEFHFKRHQGSREEVRLITLSEIISSATPVQQESGDSEDRGTGRLRREHSPRTSGHQMMENQLALRNTEQATPAQKQTEVPPGRPDTLRIVASQTPSSFPVQKHPKPTKQQAAEAPQHWNRRLLPAATVNEESIHLVEAQERFQTPNSVNRYLLGSLTNPRSLTHSSRGKKQGIIRKQANARDMLFEKILMLTRSPRSPQHLQSQPSRIADGSGAKVSQVLVRQVGRTPSSKTGRNKQAVKQATPVGMKPSWK